MILNWLLYLGLWACALAAIAGLVALAHANLWAGAAGFAGYFIGAHLAFKRMGYKRGIFDVP